MDCGCAPGICLGKDRATCRLTVNLTNRESTARRAGKILAEMLTALCADHKAHCENEDCPIVLGLFAEIVEGWRGTPLTAEERRAFQ